PKPIPAGADALDQRALRDQIDRHFSGDHLLLGLGIKADMAGDGAADEPGIDELTDTAPRERRIVRDNGQIAFALPHELVDETLGSSDAHEPPDHQGRTVGDERNGFGDGNRFHLKTSPRSRPLFTAVGGADFYFY